MTGRAWWRNASVYQLYVRSFADGNGDGIGDFAGITSRLDYIQSLGVDAIWLNPCFPSPQKDHGYDVSDYFDIEPDYGTLQDFDSFLTGAHERGLRVLLDVVPNHCSSEHELFRAAVAAGPGSPERELFWFRKGQGPSGSEPPNNWKAIFGGSAWTRITEADGSPGEWYLGVFTPHQPDWNFTHPDVVRYFEDMLRFWFDRGVDGFRADAVIYLGKVAGLPDSPPEDIDSPLNPLYTYVDWQHEIWRGWRKLVDAYEVEHDRELLLVAEAFAPDDPDGMAQYANPTEFHQAFAFDLMLSSWRAERMRAIIDRTLSATTKLALLPAWTLNNHDTQRTTTRYGREDIEHMGGFHEGVFRISSAPVDHDLGLRRARAASLLLMSLPGCIYLYAGEELGLPEVLDLPAEARQDPVFLTSKGEQLGRDGCRVPLPWTQSSDRSFGFSVDSGFEGGPAHVAAPWLPQPPGWGSLSIEVQAADPASVLSLYRTAGEIRRSNPDLRSDDFAWLDGFGPELVAFQRGDLIVVLNPGSAEASLPAAVVGGRRVLATSFSGHKDPFVVPANTTLWLQ
jgi:alpha-glucosidase